MKRLLATIRTEELHGGIVKRGKLVPGELESEVELGDASVDEREIEPAIFFVIIAQLVTSNEYRKL